MTGDKAPAAKPFDLDASFELKSSTYTLMTLALTEPEPTIKPYDQDAWAPLPDSQLPIDISLAILDGVHERWVVVWRSLTPAHFGRRFHHPEIGITNLDAQLQGYAWHSRHHVAHITALRQREGWLGT